LPLETDKRASSDTPDLATVGNRAPLVTAIVPVWDQHSAFLPRCLHAINAQHVPIEIVVIDNASEYPIQSPSNTRVIRLPRRLTVGAARNAGLQLATTPYVVFADADDELAPGSVARSIALLARHPEAIAVIGRSTIDYGDRTARGIRPTPFYRLTSHLAPALVPLLWLVDYQGSITSTLLRTANVLDAGGFADADVAEDWHLAARLSRRGPLLCTDRPVRTYHRHRAAIRQRPARTRTALTKNAVLRDCQTDPASTHFQALVAAALLRGRERSFPPPLPPSEPDSRKTSAP
jgi:glycosyltransferase involved in cell wall biosynthesis